MCARLYKHTHAYRSSNRVCQLIESVQCLLIERIECVPMLTIGIADVMMDVIRVPRKKLPTVLHRLFAWIPSDVFLVWLLTVIVNCYYYFLRKLLIWKNRNICFLSQYHFIPKYVHFFSLWMVTRWNLYSFVLFVPNEWPSLWHKSHSYKNRPACLLLLITCLRKFSCKEIALIKIIYFINEEERKCVYSSCMAELRGHRWLLCWNLLSKNDDLNRWRSFPYKWSFICMGGIINDSDCRSWKAQIQSPRPKGGHHALTLSTKTLISVRSDDAKPFQLIRKT